MAQSSLLYTIFGYAVPFYFNALYCSLLFKATMKLLPSDELIKKRENGCKRLSEETELKQRETVDKDWVDLTIICTQTTIDNEMK
jgi:hypothetical protein